MDFKKIAKLIYFHRKKAELSRNELANLAVVGKTVVFDIEHGKETIQFQSLAKVCAVLNISMRFDSPLMQEFSLSNAKVEI